MATIAADFANSQASSGKHPKGLYALFATEMWERFSFYSMVALFVLYLRDPNEGFGWTAAEAVTLYSTYQMFVYLSPLIGGFLADRFTGYRRAVMIGGVFFMAGHAVLSIPAIWAVYLALTLLVIGNGFFKPNVSTMVGNLYPEGSKLKDRAYNIFYMGINVGATSAPIVMEIARQYFGFHVAFAIAAFGMLLSIGVLWYFKDIVEDPNALAARKTARRDANQAADTAATAVDAPPHGISHQESPRKNAIDYVPDSRRVIALIVVFLIVIVFWMVFHQNGSTLTFWADDNTAWPIDISGTLSNAINPGWVIILSLPLVWFWGFLDKRGMEPSTPAKMAIGMTLTGLSFFVLYFGALIGESQPPTAQQLTAGDFRVNERVVTNMAAAGMPREALDKMMALKNADGKYVINDVKFSPLKDAGGNITKPGDQVFMEALTAVEPSAAQHREAILRHSYLFKMSAFWLLLAYAIISLGELMLSPMGLSLVSKVAPIRWRGLLMGGWFGATALGNKLTMIGIYWSIWYQSTFFIVLGSCALVMAVVLVILLKPLKKAMPGV